MKHVLWFLTTMALTLPITAVARIGFGIDPDFSELVYVWLLVVVVLVIDRLFYPDRPRIEAGE